MKGKFNCFACGKEVEFIDRVGLRDECQHCGADLHSCRNCRHYDVKVYNECRETSAEVVREKERSNFCDFFEPGDGTGAAHQAKDKMLSAAEALFKKKS